MNTGTPRSRSNTETANTDTSQAGLPSGNTRTEITKITASAATNAASLPVDKGALIRVIFENGRTSVFSVEACTNADEVVRKTIRRGQLNEAHLKNYCFWVLDGIEPRSTKCRRIMPAGILQICSDHTRPERERLMFRKIHAQEPDGHQLEAAAAISIQQAQQTRTPNAQQPVRSHMKLIKVTGESLPSSAYPISPASALEPEKLLSGTDRDSERSDNGGLTSLPRPRRLQEFGGRPPSELVVADYATYFPGEQDAVQKISQSIARRSSRLSRANSRLSTVSNFKSSFNLKDAPPLPTIGAWQNEYPPVPRSRPLSIVATHFQRQSTYRDSVASSNLARLEEELPTEPNRQSYVSFGAEGLPEVGTVSINDPDGNTVSHSYFDDSGSSPPTTDAGGSLNEQLTQALAEDDEESDEELTDFLKADSWHNVKYIRGKLIGQGSFGSVYLALHAITGELMAVKQVELPANGGPGSAVVDAKKNIMVEALKHEITLLRDLRHPHIVQYLGSSSDANTLNIFLEYIPGGSIAKMLVDYGSLNEALVANFVRQILVGLTYLHGRGIIHRDIKGANILVDNHGSVKISDFGISKRVQDSKSLLAAAAPSGAGQSGDRRAGGPAFATHRVSLQGSVFWMAPEVVRQTAYTRKADIWSLGCLIVEMLTGVHPHPGFTQLQAIFKIGGRGQGQRHDPAPEIPADSSPELNDFLSRVFAVEHEKRPEAEELLKLPFLTQIG